MKTFVPNYYSQFHCIAEKCKHTCCIGWEIDIDNDTMFYYNELKCEFGKKIVDKIDKLGDEPHFILTVDERCPFLNNKNLCEIILNIGEDALCNICTDHPRFRNFYSNRTEVGLGLCCEEAAKIILTNKDKVKMVKINDFEENNNLDDLSKEEETFLIVRDEIFKVLQDRNIPVQSRIDNLFLNYEIDFPNKTVAQWCDLYLGLEHLDATWVNKIKSLREHELKTDLKKDFFKDDDLEIVFEQILVYFVYRHLTDCLLDGRFKERLAFAVLGYKILKYAYIAELECNLEVKLDYIIDTARQYSAEIEYSEENMEALLQVLSQYD